MFVYPTKAYCALALRQRAQGATSSRKSGELVSKMALRVALCVAALVLAGAWLAGCGLFPSPGAQPPGATPAPGATPTPTLAPLPTGEVEGYVYVNPARAQARQTTGLSFIVAPTPIAGAQVPASGTQVQVGTTGLGAQLDSQGHYRIANVPMGVHDLRVLEPVDGQLVTESFGDILVLPNQVTRGTDPPQGATLTVTSPAGAQLSVGQEVDLTVELRTGSGELVQGFPDFAWTSSDDSVATVSAQGHVVARGPGTARITVAAGPLAASVDLTVQGQPGTPATVSLEVTIAQSVVGQVVVLNTLQVGPGTGSTLTVSQAAQFVVLVGSFSDTIPAQPVSGAQNGAVEPSRQISLNDTGSTAITLQPPFTEPLVLSDGRGGQLRIKSLTLLTNTSATEALLPSTLRFTLPIEGQPISAATVEASGLPDGTTVQVVMQTGQGTFSASGQSSGGSATVSGFGQGTMAMLQALKVQFQ